MPRVASNRHNKRQLRYCHSKKNSRDGACPVSLARGTTKDKIHSRYCHSKKISRDGACPVSPAKDTTKGNSRYYRIQSLFDIQRFDIKALCIFSSVSPSRHGARPVSTGFLVSKEIVFGTLNNVKICRKDSFWCLSLATRGTPRLYRFLVSKEIVLGR